MSLQISGVRVMHGLQTALPIVLIAVGTLWWPALGLFPPLGVFAGVAGFLGAVGFWKRSAALHTGSIALCFILTQVLYRHVPTFPAWPWGLVIPLLGYVVIVRAAAIPVCSYSLAGSAPRLTPLVLGAAVAAAAVVSWIVCADTSSLRFSLPVVPVYFLLPAALVFALLNSLLEEILFRGIVLRSLCADLPKYVANLVQAVAFGSIHFFGIPSGWSGVFLATIFGFGLGIYTSKTKSLREAWIVHALTDLAIFLTVFARGLHG